MKFNIGDTVNIKFVIGGEKGVIVHQDYFGLCAVQTEKGKIKFIRDKDLEHIKQDLRDLLQVGYKVVYRKFNDHGGLTQIFDEEYLDLIKSYTDQNLIDVEDDVFTINTIYRPKYNGLKPMEWVLVWEREKEKLYTLELPNCKHSKRYLCVMVDDKNVYRFSKLNPNVNRQHNHLKCFTQQEIDNLPNQELIKALVKKPVKGEQK